MLKGLRVFALFLLFAICNLQFATAEEVPAPVSAERTQDLKRLSDYLNGISSIVADFSQVAPDGSLASGKFFLKRPGKMRWQYDPPTPVLMVANGGEMVYYDYDLQQVSHIPLDSTLANFLAQEKIDLTDKFVQIEDLNKTPGMMRLTLKQTDKPEAGKLTLEFSDMPLQLRNMVITDSQGQTTTVALQNAQYGGELDNKLFVFKDPRKRRPN